MAINRTLPYNEEKFPSKEPPDHLPGNCCPTNLTKPFQVAQFITI